MLTIVVVGTCPTGVDVGTEGISRRVASVPAIGAAVGTVRNGRGAASVPTKRLRKGTVRGRHPSLPQEKTQARKGRERQESGTTKKGLAQPPRQWRLT